MTKPRSAVRTVLAALLPLAACALQVLFWPVIAPFVWFLFYPVVFFSSWLGGFRAGLASAFLSVALVWWFFLEPVHTLVKQRPGTYINAAAFLLMGWLFSHFHEVLRRARDEAADARVRERDSLLERTSRLAQVGGWEFDAVTHAGSWTPQIARIHDLDPGTQPSVEMGLDFYLERDRPAIAEAVRRAVEEGIPYDLELQFVSAAGTRKWVRTTGEPVVEAGRVVRVQGALQDITDRKRVELEIQSLNATLERRVAERTAEIQAANQELESFAYAVSHDLRAPLRAMDGFSQALLEDCAPALDAEGRMYLDQIIQASHAMSGLIDGILLLSRATRGDMERSEVDLSALAEAVLKDLARGEPGRAVRWRVEPGLAAQGDPRMLKAAFANLLGNAWKYTGKVPDPAIDVDRVEAEGRAWIRVRDNGCGFDMAFADKLYKPFQRLHRQDEFPGLGIGLATTQRIVNRHGGQLRADSAPGKGAAFLLSLPPFAVQEAP